MPTTDLFFNWYFWGMGGIGGWVFFMGLAIVAITYIISDSQWRKVRAYAWLLGAILPALLLFPTLLYRFAAFETQQSLVALKEVFFYIGLMGGIVPFVVAIGYAVAHFGMKPATTSTESPVVEKQPIAPMPVIPDVSPIPVSPTPGSSMRPHLNAWLVNEDTNHSYQLYEEDTRIGRHSSNDVVIADRSVSREHILIREDRGHFVIVDRGSTSGTYVNQNKIDGSYQLTHGDAIELGDIRLRFVTSLT
jgi:hypothetical protein